MKQPNILIVMTDHQRADTALPEHACLTPNLDKLSAQGVSFTNAFCPSPHCCPSRATFFSGLYPSGHGVWNNICNEQALSTGLNEGVRLWSEDLADAGYDLYFSGKWHVSIKEGPKDRGFNELYVSAGRGSHHGNKWSQYAEASKRPEQSERGEGQILRPGYGTYTLYGTREPGENDHDTRVTHEALDALPRLADSENPWCLYVGLIGPHDPYNVPQRFLDMYDIDDVRLPESYVDELSDKPAIYQRMREMRFGQLSQREIREGIRHFWAYCTYLDDLFGQILATLEQTGQSENTLVLYVSDHGDYNGEHGFFAKGIPCFQGAYRVPAIIRWPAGIAEPGRRVDEFVSLADFDPTFADVAGRPVSRTMAGASLVPFLKNEQPDSWRDAMFTQCNGVELYYMQRSVMTNEYKYTFNGFDRDELYDLRSDPHEMINRADDPAYAGIKRDLCKRLWRFAYDQGDEHILNSYITVALAPYGPALAFEDDSAQ